MLKVVSFNILADCWAHPKWYDGNFLDQLSTEYRYPRVRKLIAAFAEEQGVDLFLLQETQPAQVEDLFAIGGLKKNDWHVYHVPHDQDYWKSWWITDPAEIELAPWTANHLDHGVSILAKKSSFTDVAFSKILCSTGNHQAKLSATWNGKKLYFISIHYDSDSATNRQKELEVTLSFVGDCDSCLIGGDFNIDTNSANLRSRIVANNFLDAFYELKISEPTHPFSTQYYRSFNWSTIDHFLVRNFVPQLPSYVADGDLFERFPVKPPPQDEKGRIQANFDQSGSDHFPIFLTIQ